MATEQRNYTVHQNPQVWFFAFLTLCFTLCGAGACQELSLSGGNSGAKKWTELVDKGNAALKSGDSVEAEKDFVEAEKTVSKEFGKDDPRRATCLGYLAQMYRSQQEYRKAALAYKDLISINEKIDPKSGELVGLRAQYDEIKKKMEEYGIDEDPNAPHKAKPKKDVKADAKNAKAAGKKH